MNQQRLNIGVIGTGYMGLSHAKAFQSLAGMKDYPKRPFLHSVASTTEAGAARAARNMNFAHSTSNWRDLCDNPEIDIISITSPADLHFEMAQAVIKSGKGLYLEKPVTVSLEQVYQLQKLAAEHTTCITIGYNYLHNPMLYAAKELIDKGELGDLISFRAIHAEDFMAKPDAPFKYWHPDPDLGGGAIKELASHPLSIMHFLIGDMLEVSASTRQLYPIRLDAQGKECKFKGEDHIDALVRYDCGLQGTLTASWLATGKRMQLEMEIYGSKGSINFSQERLNELKLYLNKNAGPYSTGFTTLRASQEHPDFSFLCPGDEHGIGFHELKVLEARNFLDAYFSNNQPFINLNTGKIIHEQIEALHSSATSGNWAKVDYR